MRQGTTGGDPEPLRPYLLILHGTIKIHDIVAQAVEAMV
jgi:hypothetical protein